MRLRLRTMRAIRSCLPSSGLRRYQLRGGDPLLTAFAVVPGEHEDDRQADQQRERCKLLDLFRPMEGVGDVGEALQQTPSPRGVGNAPLHHLAAGQSLPKRGLLPVLRLVGHAALSLMARV